MKRKSRYGTSLICRVLLGAVIVAVSSTVSTTSAFAKRFECKPVHVAVIVGKRVGVRCNPGDGAIQYFELGVANAAEANRMYSILATAFALGKGLTLFYSPSTTDLPKNCAPVNCRRLEGAIMWGG